MEHAIIFIIVASAALYVAHRVYRQITTGEQPDKCDSCPVNDLAKKIDPTD